jgi:hypothetical protein
MTLKQHTIHIVYLKINYMKSRTNGSETNTSCTLLHTFQKGDMR